jgi:hypothetical protein
MAINPLIAILKEQGLWGGDANNPGTRRWDTRKRGIDKTMTARERAAQNPRLQPSREWRNAPRNEGGGGNVDRLGRPFPAAGEVDAVLDDAARDISRTFSPDSPGNLSIGPLPSDLVKAAVFEDAAQGAAFSGQTAARIQRMLDDMQFGQRAFTDSARPLAEEKASQARYQDVHRQIDELRLNTRAPNAMQMMLDQGNPLARSARQIELMTKAQQAGDSVSGAALREQAARARAVMQPRMMPYAMPAMDILSLLLGAAVGRDPLDTGGVYEQFLREQGHLPQAEVW